MKVLFINNYRDATGWANQGINSILALDAAGVEVVPRCIKLNNVDGKVPERILELEKLSDKHPDVVIQNVLPHMSKLNTKAGKNILLSAIETNDVKACGWATHINCMDEVWTFTKFAANAMKPHVNIPIHVIPQATDVNKFKTAPDLTNYFLPHDRFYFYTVGEFTKRKNLETLIRAFHREFHISEPVDLVIKTTPVPFGDQSMQKITDITNSIKRDLKLYPNPGHYKNEIVICGYSSDEDMNKLHSFCDCFASASHSEGWCIPCHDAMGFGKIIVAPKHTSFLEYLNDSNSYLVESYADDMYGALDTFQDLYTCSEQWYETPVSNLRKAMRQAYEQRSGRGKKLAEQCRKDINKYSYANVGKIMSSLLKGK